MKSKNVFRSSYSVLTAWESGDVEKFVGMYFKLKNFTTPQMADGKDLHKAWEEEINKTKCLPAVFGGNKLIDPKTELKLVAPIYDWMDLVGIVDLYDAPEGHEFKTGTKSSEEYANGMQVAVYALLLDLVGQPVKKFTIHQYDQYSKKVNNSYVWVTDELKEKALNWVVTLSSEAHQYLQSNGLYERFGKNT